MLRLACALLLFALVPSPVLAYDARHVFITNRGANNIVELDESLTVVRTWFMSEGLSAPNGMAFTPDGAIWVADTVNQRILAFDTAGTLLGTIATATRLGSSVESIYFGGDGTLYASANPGLGVVARYRMDRTDLPDVVNMAVFSNLGNVNLTGAGNVIVSDFSAMNRGLRELSPSTGAVMRTFGEGLGRQEDVMIDGADRVFVSHYAGDEVVVFDAARAELFRFAAPAAEPALDAPTGIALTYDCRILVVSFNNGTLFEFRHRGSAPPEFVRSVPVPGLSMPESIAIAGLRLPGGFDEFTDTVPSCEEVPRLDGGPPVDAGPRDAGGDDAGVRDAGTDAGRARPSPGGCGCRTSAAGPAPLIGPAVLLALMLAGRRRAWRSRRRRAGSAAQ